MWPEEAFGAMMPLSLFQAFAATDLAKVLDEIQAAASVTNNHDRFVFVNRSFERLFGWKREEIIGMKPIVLMPRSANRNGVAELKRQISRAPHTWSGRVRNRSKNGQELDLELATFRISTIRNLPTNLHLGIVTSPGGIQQAISELLATLSREAFQRRNSHRRSKSTKSRHEQIMEMSSNGYTMKEIAEAMGTSMNTPYVILHRARKRGEIPPARGERRRGRSSGSKVPAESAS